MDKPMQNTLAVLAKLTVENADLKVKVVALKAGLEIIERYTGNERHPNGVWDAHVIAGRLLRGEDHRGRSTSAIKSLLRELGEGSRCTSSHSIDQFCAGCSPLFGEVES